MSWAQRYERTINLGGLHPDLPAKFIVWYDRRTHLVVRVPHSLHAEFSWMIGWHIDELKRWLQEPMSEHKFERPVPREMEFVPEWQIRLEEYSARISNLMDRYAIEADVMRREGRSQFMKPWHEFAEYYGHAYWMPNYSNLPDQLARLFMDSGNFEWIRGTNIEAFFKELTARIFDGTKPIEMSYEEVHELMVDQEQFKIEIAGTAGKFKQTLTEITAKAVTDTALRKQASRAALKDIVTDIRDAIRIHKIETKSLPPGIQRDFQDLLELGDEATLQDINRFVSKYPEIMDREIRKAAEHVSAITPRKVGTIDDTAWVKVLPAAGIKKVPVFQEDLRRREGTLGPTGVSELQGQSFLRSKGLSDASLKKMGMRADIYEKPLRPDEEFIHPDMLAPEAGVERRKLIAESKRRKERGKTTPAGIKTVTKLPPMEKIIVDVDRNYNFEKGVFKASVSIKGKGTEGALSDAFIKAMYDKFGGDKDAIKKVMDAITKGAAESLEKTISAMTPVWQQMIRNELIDKDVMNIQVNKPKITIKRGKTSVKADIDFTWTKPTTEAPPKDQLVGTMPRQEIAGQESSRQTLRTLAEAARKQQVTPPATAMDKVMRESDKITTIGAISSISGDDARALIEDAAMQGANIVDNLARNLRAEPGDIMGISLVDDEPVITVLRGGVIERPAARPAALIPGKLVREFRIGAPKLEITEPMEPVSDSFRALMGSILGGRLSGNIFQQMAKFLWQFDIPLPDFERVASVEEFSRKVVDMDRLQSRIDNEINNEVARIRSGEEESVIAEIIDRIMLKTTPRIVERVAEGSEGETANIWNRSVV